MEFGLIDKHKLNLLHGRNSLAWRRFHWLYILSSRRKRAEEWAKEKSGVSLPLDKDAYLKLHRSLAHNLSSMSSLSPRLPVTLLCVLFDKK